MITLFTCKHYLRIDKHHLRVEKLNLFLLLNRVDIQNVSMQTGSNCTYAKTYKKVMSPRHSAFITPSVKYRYVCRRI